MEWAISLFGYCLMLGCAWLMSQHKFQVNWRLVALGSLLQFGIAWLLLRTDAETGSPSTRLQFLGASIEWLLSHVDVGARFVFGETFRNHPIAFKVLPSIIFFSALTSLLYHVGILQKVVWAFGWVMQYTLGTSGAESLSSAANIFVGQTEAPLVIKPYLKKMTDSELMAVMVGGFATIAGGVMAIYISFGIDAGHLVTASIISAPAALVIAKILQPEVGLPETAGQLRVEFERKTVNMLDAISQGTRDGLWLALNVGAMLLVFLSLMALVDASVGFCGKYFGQTWSLGLGLGYVCAPFAWCMGVPGEDLLQVGQLLGERIVTNEFIAYERLASWLQPDSPIKLQPRSAMIATYALCGFACFGSIGVQIGGLSTIVPERNSDFARLGFRAMLGGMLACFMTACIAGVML